MSQRLPGLGELIFREDWNAIPAARPITQEHVAHPDLILELHGPGRAQIKKSHHGEIAGDPYYVWSGKCDGAWALSLRHRDSLIDLSRCGYVRWRARQSGSRCLRLILKPQRGSWVVSHRCDGESADWREFAIETADATWRRFDIESCTAGESIASHPGPALDRIDAVGVSDLMHGDGSAHCSRLDWIEVWGRPVKRATA